MRSGYLSVIHLQGSSASRSVDHLPTLTLAKPLPGSMKEKQENNNYRVKPMNEEMEDSQAVERY